MKEQIKKHDNILVAIVITILSISFSFMIPIATENPIVTGDEIWNFQNIYKMVNGYTIYEDANVIITPIFFVIGKYILQIFGANIFIFRIYNIIIYVSLILVIYNIFKALKLTKRESFLYSLIIHYCLYTLITCGANYTIFSMIFVSLGVYISIKYLEEKKFAIINGILIYLAIFTKQNIGIYYTIGTIILQIILKGINKHTIKDLLKQGCISIIFIIISCIIMGINGNLGGFFNYTILGIKEFTNNTAITIVPFLYLMLASIILAFAIFQIKILNKQLQEKKNIIILLSLGIPLLLIAYPIINEYHVLIGMLVFIILLIYMLHISIVKEFINTKIVNIATCVIIIIFLIMSIKLIYKNIADLNLNTHYQNPYFGAIIEDEIKENIKKVNDYIKEKDEKVIIFSRRSSALQYS